MDLTLDVARREVGLTLPKSMYSMEGLQIAAHIFAARAEVLVAQEKKAFELTLRARRRSADEAALRELAGEFLNELLNQEYRFLVGRFHQKISSLIVTRALLAARGGETPAGPPAAEETPEFKAAVAALMREAEAEIARTMPKKISPQGAPLPPVREDAGV